MRGWHSGVHFDNIKKSDDTFVELAAFYQYYLSPVRGFKHLLIFNYRFKSLF